MPFYKRLDLTGKTFGRLTVDSLDHIDKRYELYRLCKCECGNTKIIRGKSLKSNQTISCGCWQIEKSKFQSITHGMSNTREYKSYSGAKERCKDTNNSDYYGRGIRFQYKSFQDFYKDLGPKPEPKHQYSLDRIDNDGNYEKGNCRWATKSEQVRNQRCDNCVRLQAEIDRLNSLLL